MKPLSNWRLRLRLKWLWLLHAYPFHWAHKPLCERFQQDVLRIGGVHLCRSCVLAYLGLGLAAAGSFFAHAWLQPRVSGLFIGWGAVTVLLSLPLWYKRWPRWFRDLLRFSMGAVLALWGYLLITGHWAVGCGGGLALAAFWVFYRALRKKRKLHACDGCPEFGQPKVCSGYTLQAERMRNFEEQATELVMQNSGFQAPGVELEKRA